MPKLYKRGMSDDVWARAAKGAAPHNGLEGGNEADGTTLYIVRAEHEGGVHPGKLNPNSKGCFIAWGGEEILLGSYEVLLDDGSFSWRRARDGHIPDDAFPAGEESDGTPLYVVRAQHEGSNQLGKIREGWNGGHISYGGKEIEARQYEVLCRA